MPPNGLRLQGPDLGNSKTADPVQPRARALPLLCEQHSGQVITVTSTADWSDPNYASRTPVPTFAPDGWRGRAVSTVRPMRRSGADGLGTLGRLRVIG